MKKSFISFFAITLIVISSVCCSKEEQSISSTSEKVLKLKNEFPPTFDLKEPPQKAWNPTQFWFIDDIGGYAECHPIASDCDPEATLSVAICDNGYFFDSNDNYISNAFNDWSDSADFYFGSTLKNAVLTGSLGVIRMFNTNIDSVHVVFYNATTEEVEYVFQYEIMDL